MDGVLRCQKIKDLTEIYDTQTETLHLLKMI
mgnify:CR=1 FL=1